MSLFLLIFIMMIKIYLQIYKFSIDQALNLSVSC